VLWLVRHPWQIPFVADPKPKTSGKRKSPPKTGWSPHTGSISIDDGREKPRARKTDKADDDKSEKSEGERIAKVIARAGVCSRRDAEKKIAENRVTLDGKIVTTPATKVNPGQVVTVDGTLVGDPAPARLWRYHKPAGLVTTHRDPEGRPTVFANLPKTLPRVVSIGRLDCNSEGLLLLTNDGEIARRLEMPSGGWTRVYRARLFGKVTQADLDKLAEGVTIGTVKYGPVVADLERTKGVYSWATVTLKEGKNREVKRLMESLGLKVARLIRVQFGPFHLGQLEEGAVEEIPAKQWREQLGIGRKKHPKDD
jgi:23S rRNA pseudouridine2605 synthase